MDEPDVVKKCAKGADIDPIAHIAVARPDALPLFLDIVDLNTRNSFGKTPLMPAANSIPGNA